MTHGKATLPERCIQEHPDGGEIYHQAEIGLVLIYISENYIEPPVGKISFGKQLVILNHSAEMIWVEYPENFYAGQSSRYRSVSPFLKDPANADSVTVTAANGDYQLDFYDSPPAAAIPKQDRANALVGQVPIRVSGGPDPQTAD